MISSTASRSFALSVLPVETRSTMASARPTSGASSIEPYSRDQVDMDALGREVLTRDVDVLRRDPQARSLAHRAFVVEALPNRHRHAARGDAEVDRLVEALAAVLDQHVAPGHAEIRAAMLHVGRRVGRAHDDEPHPRSDGSRMSLRELSPLPFGSSPMRARRGAVSSKIRPRERAILIAAMAAATWRRPKGRNFTAGTGT